MPTYLDQIRITDSRSLVWDVDTLSWVQQTTGFVALVPSVPVAVSVGTSSAEAVASNATRAGLVVVNLSEFNISLGLDQTAVLNAGITLQPGVTWRMGAEDFTTGPINAIAGAAASALSVQEFTRT